MTGNLPPRSDALETIPVSHDGVVVGKVPVRGIGFRVGLSGAGKTLVMTPARARRFAAEWRSDAARAVGLDWIADALVEAADEIDTVPVEEQRRKANEMWATINARGSRQ